MRNRVQPLLLLLCAGIGPCRADLVVNTQLCLYAIGVNSQDCTYGLNQTLNKATPNPSGGPDQVFDGSASASATFDSFHFTTSIDLSNYRHDMYVWGVYGSTGGFAITQPAASYATLTDGVTVTGGSGVYSLSYLFSVDGTLTASDPSFNAQFCASLFIPTGQGTVTGFCDNANQPFPSNFTLTYADLPFGEPVDPTLSLLTALLPPVIYPADVPALGATTFSGSASADFGSTITLDSLLVTDSNGNPIPGVKITSSSGYNYPLNPANTVPEPNLLIPLWVCIAFACSHRFRLEGRRYIRRTQ